MSRLAPAGSVADSAEPPPDAVGIPAATAAVCAAPGSGAPPAAGQRHVTGRDPRVRAC